MEDPRLRQLRIKTGVLKRAIKDKQSYEVELQNERRRLEAMTDDGRDSHDLAKQTEVIQETESMLPGCDSRIFNAYNDLKNSLQEADVDIFEDPVFEEAKQALNSVLM